MTKLAPAMYEECRRAAIKKGPTVYKVNGEQRVVYALSREELAKIFVKAGYRKERVAWLKVIMAFRDVWDEIAPKDSVLLNPEERWYVVFVQDLSDTEILDLKFYAEDVHIPSLVAEA